MDSTHKVVIAKIRAALKSDRHEAAIRELLKAVEHRHVPNEATLWEWLQRNLGLADAKRLVAAFAELPCYYCKGGVEKCDRCNGSGKYDATAICTYCLALGIASCDFCNGAGLATYNIVPASLRLKTLEARVRIVIGQAASLVKTPIKSTRGLTPRLARRQLAGQLFTLDRVMGILENAVSSAKEAAVNKKSVRVFAARIIRVCRRAAIKLDGRMRAILKQMEAIERAELAGGASSGARKLADQRAGLYRTLRQSRGFTGSTLQHPFLKLGAGRR